MNEVAIFLRLKLHEPQMIVWQHEKTAVGYLDT
jgi:hypothetical protein